jgi:hypothetical protein
VEDFTRPETREIRHDQRTAEHGASQRRPATTGETLASLQKPTAFGMGQDPSDEGASMNAEKPGPGERGPRLLQGEKATELSNERQPMLPGGFGFLAAAGDEGADDVHRDHRVVRREPVGEEAVENPERPRLVVVAIAGGALAVEKPVKSTRQG